MIGMLKRHEVEILLEAGHSQSEVARLTGVGLRSVRRIAKEPPVSDVDDAAEREKRRIGRPNLVENFRFWNRSPTCPRWKFSGGCARRAMREARPRCMG
jgi:hypothetical protein